MERRREIHALRSSPRAHRPSFLIGALVGLVVVIIKFIIFLPIDIADLLYGASLSITLAITAGEFAPLKFFLAESKTFNLVVGILFPLDCYAVLILFGVPLTN